MTQDKEKAVEREAFEKWWASVEDDHGSLDEIPAWAAWQARATQPPDRSVRHHCSPVSGQPSRMIERVGRDRESAIAAWNRRATQPPAPADRVALAEEAMACISPLIAAVKESAKDGRDYLVGSYDVQLAAAIIRLRDAPPAAQAVPQCALLEAVDTILDEAPCDCPHSMRFDRGDHMSGCYLFDLNITRVKMLSAAIPDVSTPPEERK
jgi:hypothetical protein